MRSASTASKERGRSRDERVRDAALYTAQILDGFQSNPYRSVILGQGVKRKSTIRTIRARQSVAVKFNFYLRTDQARGPDRRARVSRHVGPHERHGRARSGALLLRGFRVAARGRYYKQGAAVFWSDDYTGGAPPLGRRVSTGGRPRALAVLEHQPRLRLTYAIQPQKRILGLMSGLKLGASADVIDFSYDEYTLGGTPITNARAYILGLNLSALF